MNIFRDFNQINSKEQAKLLKGSIIPRPIAWVSSVNQFGVVNLAPFSYFNMISSSLITISFQRNGMVKKDTANNILINNEAVINIPSENLIQVLDNTSEEVGSNVSEVLLNNLTLSNSTKIKVPGILESLIRIEAKLVEHIKLNDYSNSYVEADLFILRVVGITFNEKVIDQSKNYVLIEKLKPLSRLGGPNYGKTIPIKDYVRKFNK